MTRCGAGRLHLGKQVLDKGLLDRNGQPCGKVDDLLFVIPDHDVHDRPRVEGLVTGPGALAGTLPIPLRAVARAILRLLGIAHPRPVEVGWQHVTRIGPAIELDLDARESGITAVPDAVSARIIRHLPGAD